jgi:hypothetical protein
MACLRAHVHLTPFVSQCLATLEALSSGMGGAQAQTQIQHQQPCQGSSAAAATGLSSSSVLSGAVPLQDLLFQDVGFDSADAFLWGMEDMSWLNSLAT